jgi:HK97 family phage prohead protease
MTLLDTLRGAHKLGPDADVGVRWCPDAKMETNEPERIVNAVANTAGLDLDNEVVLPDGVEMDDRQQPAYFKTSRAILLNHDPNQPVGSMMNARRQNGSWVIQFRMSDKTQLARDTFGLIIDGVIRGVSIGFQALRAEPPTDEEVETYGPARSIVKAWRWLETSVTQIPANPEAWITSVKSGEIHPDDDLCRELARRVKVGAIDVRTATALGMPVPKPRRVVFLG